ncbi:MULTISPECIES: hypothetical protein [Acetobacter]|uniref:hypothetical protein n=1 Tax=Acetobacter TaxID=434 RepID=UPI003770425B
MARWNAAFTLLGAFALARFGVEFQKMNFGYSKQVKNSLNHILSLLFDPFQNKNTFYYILVCISVLCGLFSIWSWYPGIIRDDAMAQYLQAVGAEPVTDWHPPLMVRLWQLQINTLGTANLLNATLIIILSFGLFIFLKIRPCVMSLILYPIIFFSPIFFGIMGFIYKDILLSNLIFLTVGVYFSYAVKGKIPGSVRIILCMTLFTLTFLRFNAAFIVAPLLVMILVGWSISVRNILLTGLLIISLACVVGPVNHILLRSGSDHPEKSLEVFDLGGIAHYSLPKEKRTIAFKMWTVATEQEKLSACYLPRQWDEYGMWVPVGQEKLHIAWDMWGTGGVYSTRTINKNAKDSRVDMCFELGNQLRSNPSLGSKWYSEIKSHPIAYMHHRFKHFSYIIVKKLGANASSLDAGYYSLDLVDKSQIQHHFISRKYTKFIDKNKYLLTSYGLTYLILMVFVFFKSISCMGFVDKTLNSLSFSSIIYIFGYFFVGVGSQFRYILPSIYLAVASLLIIYISKGYQKRNLL